MTFRVRDKEYSYTFKELKLEINKEAIIDEIIASQKMLTYRNKLEMIKCQQKKKYAYKLKYDRNYLIKIVTDIKNEVDVNVVYDNLVMNSNRELTYNPGVEGFILDVNQSVNAIVTAIDNDVFGDLEVDLIGDVIASSKNSELAVIDSKVSSFTTKFNPYITRAINLRVALSFIDGVIIQPGDEFSFYKYAGPYDRDGYVFYYEFIGNGVCQIATTVYNAALLGGLEIVKRYPHKAKSIYVPGGLDATVASYSSGWYVDMAFKNTYDYPIYISAYAVDGEAHVDFWSNHDAKKGKTYKTSSVQIGPRGYTSYLYVFENGVEVEKRKIATTWYLED